MLPASYQLPAALVLVLAGALACFYGYRFFRAVLAVFGFILGALAVTSTIGDANPLWLLGGALIGGLIGSLVLVAAYFLGVAIVGAGLGAMVAHAYAMTGGSEPGLVVLVVCATVGAIASVYLERYVVILGTAFLGAWTLLLGGMALAGDTAAAAASASDLWIVYPLDFAPDRPWIKVVWVVLGLVGAGVQLGWTGGEKGRVSRRKKA